METRDKVGLTLLVLLALYTTFGTILLTHLTEMSPGYIVDEICHIPQVQHYCKGNFTYWDPRITTLPGLYLLSVGVLKPLSLFWNEDLCDTFNLRLNNVIISAANLALFYWIVEKLHSPGKKKDYSSWKGLLAAFNLAIFPALYFFSFVYYTDMAAVFMVLLVYYFHLTQNHVMSALLGIIAVLMRQTNIIWIAYIGIRTVDLQLQQQLRLTSSERNLLHSPSQIQVYLRAFHRLLYQPWQQWAKAVGIILVNALPYLIDVVLFAAFLILNHGIVVGDRSAHQPTFHLPQLFYYCAFVVIFAGAYYLPLVVPFFKAITRNKVRVLVLGLIITLVVRYNTLVHPYLLADNRHFTFYIWMRFFQNNSYFRYILFPLYLFGGYGVSKFLLRNETFLSTVAFWACTTVVLVLQKLLEIRYFFIPFLLLKLHIRPASWKLLILDTCVAVVINVGVFYIFMTKTFKWPDSDEVQRLMW